MSGLVELAQAAHLHRAEDRWLDACAERLRRASSPGRAAAAPTSEPVEPTTPAEAVR